MSSFFRNYWLARRTGARISSSAILRGRSNLELGRLCRIARLVELNASRGHIVLGEGVSIGPYCIIEARGGKVVIGQETVIGPFCVLYGHGGLTIGRRCLIASHVVCIPENHRFAKRQMPIRLQGTEQRGIHIGDDVWLASQVVILDGVSIGSGAVIGAGAVVTDDIPAYAIAVGVPARVIGFREE